MKESFTDTDILNMLLDPMQKEKGFRLLMKTYGKALYWHIRRIVVSKEDAEDALQEASIKIFRSIGSFRGESKITSWIYRICTNEAI
ncbi:MAG: RNA polymerase subunit sigma-70, partial [Bacteroidales bacterium]|nr:RNA polymerase subunit sigma-70 [Bacteroidales bacterium]